MSEQIIYVVEEEGADSFREFAHHEFEAAQQYANENRPANLYCETYTFSDRELVTEFPVPPDDCPGCGAEWDGRRDEGSLCFACQQ